MSTVRGWVQVSRYALGAKADPMTARARAQCGNGEPRCERAPAPGVNPLGLCDTCLAAYPGVREVCQRCASIPGVPYVHCAGGMCFGCGMSPGGTLCGPAHVAEARESMRRALGQFVGLAREGKLDLAACWHGSRRPCGAVLAALLSRAPDGMARQALIALRAALPAVAIEQIVPAHLAEEAARPLRP